MVVIARKRCKLCQQTVLFSYDISDIPVKFNPECVPFKQIERSHLYSLDVSIHTQNLGYRFNVFLSTNNESIQKQLVYLQCFR